MTARLDQAIVAAGLAESRARAQALIAAGVVLVNGVAAKKSSQKVNSYAEIVVTQNPNPWVSRAALKLDYALKEFGLSPNAAVCLDVGASTGGFTDCLLQHGAAKVYAVDVGYGQLDWSLRQDERVVVMERTNIRGVSSADLDEAPSLFVADCSFISLKKILEALVPLLADDAEGLVLIKPQFEARKEQVGEGGVIRDPEIHQEVINKVIDEATALGFTVSNVVPSPLEGPAGNKEFLAYLTRGRTKGG